MSAIERLVFDHRTVVGETFDFGKRRPEVALVAIGATLRSCTFRNFTNMAISFSSGLERTVYEDCCFENVRFFRPLSANYELRRCQFVNCTFDTWFTDKADIIDCSFTGAIKSGVMAAQSGPATSTCVITGNDFSGASLRDFGFRFGVDLSKQRLPTGPEYFLLLNGAHAVRSVYDEVTGWSDLSARKEVLYHLRGLKMDVDDGQKDIFLTSLGVPRQRRTALLELEGLLNSHASNLNSGH